MLISSPNTLTDTPRITFDHISGNTGPNRLTHKSSHHHACGCIIDTKSTWLPGILDPVTPGPQRCPPNITHMAPVHCTHCKNVLISSPPHLIRLEDTRALHCVTDPFLFFQLCPEKPKVKSVGHVGEASHLAARVPQTDGT